MTWSNVVSTGSFYCADYGCCSGVFAVGWVEGCGSLGVFDVRGSHLGRSKTDDETTKILGKDQLQNNKTPPPRPPSLAF